MTRAETQSNRGFWRVMLYVLVLAAVISGGEPRRAEASCQAPRNYSAFAKETITVSTVSIGGTTATFAPTGQAQASAAIVTIETNTIRFWSDGSAPTTTVGHVIVAGQSFEICGEVGVRNFRMIRVSADATAQVSYLR